jgi:hypothetical protein
MIETETQREREKEREGINSKSDVNLTLNSTLKSLSYDVSTKSSSNLPSRNVINPFLF